MCNHYFRRAALIAAAVLASCFAAHADDKPVRLKPIPQAAAPFSWTGFYIGGQFAGAIGATGWNDPTDVFSNSTFPAKGAHEGILGGAQAGFNYQIGAVVLGVAGEFNWAKIDGNANCGQGGSALVCHAQTDSLATLTGRIGYAWDRTLLYAKGGAAWAKNKYDASSPSLNSFIWSGSETRLGWTVGGGIEYALAGNWSVIAEYDYLSFNTKTVTLTNPVGDFPAAIDSYMHLGKIGLNYRFAASSGGATSAYAEAPGWFGSAPPSPMSNSQFEFGARYWFSSGKSESNLYDNTVQSQHNSTLIYKSLAHSGEVFARLDHKSGVFVKGYAGAGIIPSGRLNDEDYPPLSVPYSNTQHDVRNSTLRYVNIDLGYNFLTRPTGRLGAFVGYHYVTNRLNAYGCTQLAPGASACPQSLSSPGLALSETEEWQSLRLGLNGQIMLTDRLSLSGDAAYLPYVWFDGSDNHWFRPDINPLPQIAHSKNYGVQLEAILSYLVTDRLSVGIGGRYWFMQAQGHSTFPGQDVASPEHYTTQRYGVFVQTSYRLDGQ